MSSHTMSSKQTNKSGEIDLTAEFSQQMSQLCMNAEYSDVTFIVENCSLSAHKIVLAARSPYFRAMLYGGLAESSQSEIELNVPLEAFKALLGYIYTGCISLTKMKEENVLDTLGLANQYGFETLELAISDYLKSSLSLMNCCAILDAARLYDLETLSDFCMTFMDRNSTELLSHSTFKALSQDSLCCLLKRDSFFAPEVQIFNAVYDWCKNNPDADTEAVVSFVRLPLMNLEQFFKIVRLCKILSPERLLDAIQEKTTSKNLLYRGALYIARTIAIENNRIEPSMSLHPYFDFDVPRNITARVGQTAFIRCHVEQLGDKSVSWIRKRDLHILTAGILTYTSDERFQVIRSTDSENWTLEIKFSQARDSGIYECQVNTEPKMSMAFRLNIVEAKAVVVGPTDIYIKAGSEVILTCIVSQGPHELGSIFWYRDSTSLDVSSDYQTNDIDYSPRITVDTKWTDALRSRLKISAVRVSDSGNYTCMPTTAEGASVIVHVINGEHPAAMQRGCANNSANVSILLYIISLSLFLQQFNQITHGHGISSYDVIRWLKPFAGHNSGNNFHNKIHFASAMR